MMTPKQWLDHFASHLADQGLPQSYVTRCTFELRGHLEEAQSSGVFDKDVSLGSPAELANQFVQSYRNAIWFRRVPSLLWCFIPAPLAIVVTVGVYGILGVVLDRVSCLFPAHTIEETMPPIILWCYFVGKLAAPLTAAYLLLRLLRNLGRPRWVRTVAMLVLSVMFLFLLSDLHMISLDFTELNLNLTDDVFSTTWMTCWQLGQAAAVIAVALREPHYLAERALIRYAAVRKSH